MTTAHIIYEATTRQIAGLEMERAAHLEQIAGLVAERDALRAQVAELTARQAAARIITAVEEFGGICDRTGCKAEGVEYCILPGGAVYLCAAHAAEVTA